MIAALRASGIDVTYLPNHLAANEFPQSEDELSRFDAVLLSDIGADTAAASGRCVRALQAGR